MFDLGRISANLPAASLVAQIADQRPRVAVIQAPPGSGKTTVVPPAVANLGSGRVVVTQPRRIAAQAAAARLRELSGLPVGYTVRGDRDVPADAKVEFVTTGVLIRRLLRDPELAGVSAVILDEVHERSIDSDLACAFVAQVAAMRDDLRVYAMSATLDSDMWTGLLTQATGEEVALLSAHVPTFECETVWGPGPRPLTERGVDWDFLDHVASVAITEAGHRGERGGDVLVFVPGAREIERVAASVRRDFPTEELSGRLSVAAQQRIVRGHVPGSTRVIVATNIAESAITVPGVRSVVDAGLDRQARFDSVRGMSGLVTVGASKAAMVQRAGRAHREAPGRVIRCMSQADFASRPAHTPPEITTSDLTSTVLDLAVWGTPLGVGLDMPTELPPRATERAVQALTALGALDEDGEATPVGHRLACVPADPHVARALFDGVEKVGPQAVRVACALASDDRARDVPELVAKLSGTAAFEREVARLSRIAGVDAPQGSVPRSVVGLVTALARPEWIARHRGDTYLTASGTGVRADGFDDWIAIASMARAGSEARAQLAVSIDEATALEAAGALHRTVERAEFTDSKVQARKVEELGAIELASTPVQPSAQAVVNAVRAACETRGLRAVVPGISEQPGEGDPAFEALRARLGFVRAVVGDPWPDVTLDALQDLTWLEPDLEALGRGQKINLAAALQRVFPWPEAARFNELVPERLEVPSGAKVRVSYPTPESHGGQPEAPVLAVKLQECFGLADTPSILGRPVLMHLLSPARRPLAVTDDLRSFWNGAYAHVRAENRGKYSKHPWPEDPWNAVPTARTNRSAPR